MAWGYKVWDENNTLAIDTSTQLFPFQSFKGSSSLTASSTAVAHDANGIGTSNLSFSYGMRILPASVHANVAAHTRHLFSDSASYNAGTGIYTWTYGLSDGDPFIREDVTTWGMNNWTSDREFRAKVIIVPFAL
jgi:hypothetical protein